MKLKKTLYIIVAFLILFFTLISAVQACPINQSEIIINNQQYCTTCKGAVIEKDGQMMCIQCPEGFEIENGGCALKNIQYNPPVWSQKLDQYAEKIGGGNALVGYGIGILVLFGAWFIWKSLKK